MSFAIGMLIAAIVTYAVLLTPVLLLVWGVVGGLKRISLSTGTRRVIFVIMTTLMCAPVTVGDLGHLLPVMGPNLIGVVNTSSDYLRLVAQEYVLTVPGFIITAWVAYFVSHRINWATPRASEAHSES